MSDLSLDAEMNLFDKDIFDDDYLGESGLDENRVAKIKFTQASFSKPRILKLHPIFILPW